MDQPSLFEPDDPPPLRRPSGGYRQPSRKPAYRRYTATHKPLPCDDCMALHIEGPAPIARTARTVRQVTGEPSRYLCGEHAQHWRTLDAQRKDPK